MFTDLQNWWNGTSISAKFMNWCSRHLTIVGIIIIGLYALGWERELIRLTISAITISAIVPLIANICRYVYTKFKFINDDKLTSNFLSYNILGAWLFIAIYGAVSLYYQSDKIQGDEAKIDAQTIQVDTMAIRKALIEDKITTGLQVKLLDSLSKDTIKK